MHDPYEPARRLTRRLGDPDDAGRVFGHARCAEADGKEELPEDICRELDAAGVAEYYVPAEYGGGLRRYDELLHLLRVIAGRDLTVAIAHGKTFLGAVCVWVAGSEDQCRRLGVRITSGRPVALALTEEDHGSDLLAGQVSAVRQPEGWRLNGRKWLINNANRAELVTVLARTRPDGGPRGFGVLLVDKSALAPGGHRCLPRIPTHGIRGADIAGIEFHDADLPHEALVGTAETGVDTVLTSLQVTRTLCAALSLGAADHALRIGLGFAHRHILYGQRLADLPEARRILMEAWTDLSVAEVLGVVATRSVHTLPAELAVTSAVVKSFVPTIIGDTFRQLGKLLGARAFLVDDVPEAGFQKIERDHAVVGIFDGSTVVNLHALVNQFPALATGYRRAKVDRAGLDPAVRLDDDLPRWDRDRLAVVSMRGSSLVQALPELCGTLMTRVAEGSLPPAVGAYAEHLLRLAEETHAEITAQLPVRRQPGSVHFALARRYALCFAAAACVAVWLNNPRLDGTGSDVSLWTSGHWLEACLGRLLGKSDDGGVADTSVTTDQIMAVLDERHRAGAPYSLLSQVHGVERGTA